MCGRFVASAPPSTIAEQFAVDEVVEADIPPSWNVAPTMEARVVALSGDGRRVLEPFRWGLVPYWADNPSIGSRLINARVETVATARAFRSALARRRCLVPVDGFYEWQDQPPAAGGRAGQRRSPRAPSGARRGAPRQPYYVRPAGGGLLALAGLWERWRDAEGLWLLSFTIVTTPANQTLEPLHGRMPAVLGPESWERWLDHQAVGASAAAEMLVPAGPEVLEARRASREVNDPRNDGPELIEEPAESAG